MVYESVSLIYIKIGLVGWLFDSGMEEVEEINCGLFFKGNIKYDLKFRSWWNLV